MTKTKDTIQSEAFEVLKERRTSGVEISVGMGKTRLAIMHMLYYYTDVAKYLIVAPKKAIYVSWSEEIKKLNVEHLIDCMSFSTYRSLNKQDLDYDFIYLDECHSLKSTHNEWLKAYLKEGGRILGLTGTYPIYANTEKGKMCNFYCPKVYVYKTDDAIADKLLNDYSIIVHELNLNADLNITRDGKHGEFKTSEVKDYAYWSGRVSDASDALETQMVSIQRMKALQRFTSKETYARSLLNEQTDKTIIFTNTQNQADNLCEHTYHSKNPDSEDNLTAFKNGNINRLGAVEQLNEGVNIPHLKVGIIMHSYSNNRKASQKIGRLLRLNPNETATIHILCYTDTIDKIWVTNALKDYNQNKITWKTAKQY